MDSTVIYVPCMLEHVWHHEPFSLKIVDLEDTLSELVKFCVLSEIHACNPRFKQINENLTLHVLHACSGSLCTRFHILSFINNWEKSFSGGNDLLCSNVYPRNSYFMMPKSLFIIKNSFSDLKLYSLHISVILNKKKNFHDSNFSRPLVWKMTVATPWPINFANVFSNYGKKVKTRSHKVWEP